MLVLRSQNARTIRIKSGQWCTIGSSPAADFRITSKGVARLHCRIRCRKLVAYVECPDASNSIQHNGTATNRCKITNNDRLNIAGIEFVVGLHSDEMTSPPVESLDVERANVDPLIAKPTTGNSKIPVEPSEEFSENDTVVASSDEILPDDLFDFAEARPAINEQVDALDLDFVESAERDRHDDFFGAETKVDSNSGALEAKHFASIDQTEYSDRADQDKATEEMSAALEDESPTFKTDSDQAFWSPATVSEENSSLGNSSVDESVEIEPEEEEGETVPRPLDRFSTMSVDTGSLTQELRPENQSTVKAARAGQSLVKALDTRPFSTVFDADATRKLKELLSVPNMKIFGPKHGIFNELESQTIPEHKPESGRDPVFLLSCLGSNELNLKLFPNDVGKRIQVAPGFRTFLELSPRTLVTDFFDEIEACLVVKSSSIELTMANKNSSENIPE